MAVSRVLVGTINYSETQQSSSNTITDLTGTTWVFNSTLTEYTLGTKNIGFNSGDFSFTSIRYNSSSQQIAYVVGTTVIIVYDYSTDEWNNNYYKTITITGGTDATNSDLIVWLTNNATLQVEPEPDIILQKTTLCMKKAFPGTITDLTNTTWIINEIPNLNSHEFIINFTSNNDSYYKMYVDDYAIYYGYGIYYIGNSHVNAYNLFTTTWLMEALRTITITSGTDVTNQDLIDWLYANATLISGAPTTYQLVPVSVMRKVAGGGSAVVTDLTNTTWEFNATSTVMPGPIEPPSGTSLIGTLTTPDNTIINIVNYGPGEMSGDIILLDENDTVLEFTRAGAINKGKTLGTYTLHITSGTLTTNSNLINALTTYWTQVGGVSLQPLAIEYTSKLPAIYTITTTILNGTYSGDITIQENRTATVTLSASSGYELPRSITVSGASHTYNSTTGVISLNNPTENVIISATCVATPYLAFSSPDTFTLKVVNNRKYWNGTLEYSTDAINWSTWAGTSAISSSSSGSKKVLYLRGTGNTYITGSSASSSYAKWVLTGSNISCSGNIENLLDYQTVANGNHPAMANYCYYLMFYGCTNLITAPSLLATTLSEYCYYTMFGDCTNLITAPELPATTLANACYYSMFRGCTHLTTITTSLPATTLARGCYTKMFENCSSITTAPTISATTLAWTITISSTIYGCCKYMFNGCTSLTTPPPTLPATNLTESCYSNMFYGCTSLTTTPSLPATTLANSCYAAMFSGCSSLTTPPTTLPAITATERCYMNMFSDCTNLTTAPSLSATTLAYGCYWEMFSGCTSLTTAPSLPATNLANDCYVQMFKGCTSLINVPNTLPATTLAKTCYSGMFNGCTSLTTAPSLPATTLAPYCYRAMFYNCTNLTAPAIMAGGRTQATSATYCCNSMYYNCTALNIYTSSSGHTSFYKAITYSTSDSDTNYGSSEDMFFWCKINGTTSTTRYLTAGTQYYY